MRISGDDDMRYSLYRSDICDVEFGRLGAHKAWARLGFLFFFFFFFLCGGLDITPTLELGTKLNERINE